MKSVATVLQITRGLLILTPSEYEKSDGGLQIKSRKGGSGSGTVFNVPQVFELNDSLKERPYEKSEELAAFVKRCAESVQMELGDIFMCIEDEDILITKEYKHPVAKEKLLPTFARVEAENVLHNEVSKHTVLNFEYGQQYGKASKTEDVSASLFAMNTALLMDIRSNFESAGLHIVKIAPPIAGMLYTAKMDINSATRSIALLSVDYAAIRLVILRNGAPVFQQSYSSILEDIVELLMLEFGMSKLGVLELIRAEGLGVCNKCHSAQTRKQTMTMLSNAVSEVVRSLRMVMSTMRIDIDLIVYCDTLAKVPNLAAYCRQEGLSAPNENVISLFSGGKVPPVASQAAVQNGYDASSFITLNGLLNMPVGEANLLRGSILSDVVKENKSKIGNFVAGTIGVIAAAWMAITGGWWAALQIRENNDNATLEEPKYKRAEQLVNEEKEYIKKLEDLAYDVSVLPRTVMKTSGIVTHFYTDIEEQVESTSGISFSHNEQKISTNIVAKDFDAIVDFKYKLNDEGYFHIGDNFVANIQRLEKSNTTTELYGYSGGITVTITEQAQAEGAAEFEKDLEAKAVKDAQKREEEKKKEKEKEKKSSETSKTETSQSSKSTV